MPRLSKTVSHTYRGNATYLVSYDHASGRTNRYAVWILTSEDPITIGLELSLKEIRSLINRYEPELVGYTGLRSEVREAALHVNKVTKKFVKGAKAVPKKRSPVKKDCWCMIEKRCHCCKRLLDNRARSMYSKRGKQHYICSSCAE